MKKIGMTKITEIGELGLKLIIEFEKFEPIPYLCPSDVATQGFGTTRNPDTGKLIKLTDKPIDLKTAMRWLKADCKEIYGPIVDRLCRDDLNQNEYDALVSFTYNTGGYYINSKGKRIPYQLYSLVNAKTSESVLTAYWSGTAVTGKGVKLAGLVRRRIAEPKLYFTPITK